MNINPLPDVARIEGLQLQHSGSADPATHRVEVQYTDRTPGKQLHSLTMPLLDALYLLNLLEAMARDHRFDHLRQPPGNPPQ